jgi:hypothetical protein
MPDKTGLAWSEIRRKIGNLSQVISVDSFIDEQGLSRGSRRIRMINGGGLDLELFPDRALDIGKVMFDGVNIGWISPVGPASPHFVENYQENWLRTFSGGFLTTCGLDSFGAASSFEGKHYPLHGRISSTPSSAVNTSVDEDDISVSAEIRQSSTFSENLLLKREISSKCFSNSFSIKDQVTNESYRPQTHMILYHFNVGWPLVDYDTKLRIPTVNSESLKKSDDPKTYKQLTEPTVNLGEAVFLHKLEIENKITFENYRLGLSLEISVESKNLPNLFQWKMLDEGYYVVGIEPANTDILTGRANAELERKAPVLEPWESVNYEINISFSRL